jgi:hypothetical protein
MELCTTLFDMIATRKSLFQRKLFMEMFIIAAWGICRQRNGLIFDNRPASVVA